MENLESTVTFIILHWFNFKNILFYLKKHLLFSMEFASQHINLSTGLPQKHLSSMATSLVKKKKKKLTLDPDGTLTQNH